jgi:hypothetical protein
LVIGPKLMIELQEEMFLKSLRPRRISMWLAILALRVAYETGLINDRMNIQCR